MKMEATARPMAGGLWLFIVNFFRNMKFWPNKRKPMEKPPLTIQKPYDILLYCISMDKSPLPTENFNRMS